MKAALWEIDQKVSAHSGSKAVIGKLWPRGIFFDVCAAKNQIRL
jgi:uncharacterized protein YeaO (DUF488 family)